MPRLRPGDLVRMRGERWRIVRQSGYGDAAIVEAAGCGTDNRAARARFLLPWEPVERLPASPAPRRVSPARWRHVARHALAEASLSWASLRAAARATVDVIPFQLEPALALTRGVGCRFLLADAVGLGKTIQAGLIVAETLARRPDARALVISPAALRDQWCDELRRFHLDAAMLDAAGIARLAAQLPPDVNPWAVRQVAIASIDYVKRPETLRALEALTWDVVVFDEAHNLAGRSDRAAAAALIADRARTLALLTATPHAGDDAAFTRLCSLGNPDGAEPLVVFRRTRADAAVAGSRRAPLLRVSQTRAEQAMHKALMAYARRAWTEAAGGGRLVASVLARRACSSAGALARSVERRLVLLCDGARESPQQPALPYGESDDGDLDAVLGAPALRDPVDERRRLEELLALAREAAAGESKLAVLRRLLSRIREPAIVFTEYRDTLLRAAAAIGDDTAAHLHGGQTPRERAEALRRFTAGGARLLLATDAGSEGLNLHHRCRLVINLELPWTPLRLEQRAGRVDRIGQTRRVHVVHLVATGTCEEATLARLAERMHRSRGTLSAFEALPDEASVAESALAERPLAVPDRDAPAVPPGVVSLDLRHEALAEAAWIRQARAFGARAGDGGPPGRPVVARVRGRSRRTAAPRAVWLFRLAFVSAAGHFVWESLVGLTADLPRRRDCRDADRWTALDPGHPALEQLLRGAGRERLRALRASLHGALPRWSERERALMETLRARHARLSAPLVQRGLFDRRSERLADAQSALLERALSQSHERLASLAAARRIRLDACELIFFVALE